MLDHMHIFQHLKFESRDKQKLYIDILNIKYGDKGFLDALKLLLMELCEDR